MDEVDSTSQALIRLKDIVIRRINEKERLRREQEAIDYENLRKDMGLNNSIEKYLGTYTSW